MMKSCHWAGPVLHTKRMEAAGDVFTIWVGSQRGRTHSQIKKAIQPWISYSVAARLRDMFFDCGGRLYSDIPQPSSKPCWRQTSERQNFSVTLKADNVSGFGTTAAFALPLQVFFCSGLHVTSRVMSGTDKTRCTLPQTQPFLQPCEPAAGPMVSLLQAVPALQRYPRSVRTSPPRTLTSRMQWRWLVQALLRKKK